MAELPNVPAGSTGFAGAAGASQYSRDSTHYSHAARKKSGRKTKIAIVVLSTFLVLAVGVVAAWGLVYLPYMESVNKALHSTTNKTEEEIEAIEKKLAPVRNYKDPFYMMLIGSDAREDEEEMGHRSDTNILVRIDPMNCVVTMISIPRDTKIYLDGYGTVKFNAAYNYGGAASTIEEAGQLCGVPIAHYAEINFDQLIRLIDTVGGVEVDVPEYINDPDAGNIIIKPGLQTLDGEAALVFARSRAYADGDFTRTSNQRLLIEALVKKILAQPLQNLPGVVLQAAACVTVDQGLTAEGILDLAVQFKDIGKLTIYSVLLPAELAPAPEGEPSYVIADMDVIEEMMQLVEAGQDPNLALVGTPYAPVKPEI
ncbi:MAG: LCP family protein [Coriobacteriaceae bacterium]|nr:LCP family protein [Coriobacteriaceae bacterium]